MPLSPDQIKTIVRGAKVTAGAVTAAVTLIVTWEGGRVVGYRDIVGVATDCYGHTGPDVVVGHRNTPAECETKLAKDVLVRASGIRDCIGMDVPDRPMAAFISLSYNIGVTGFCRGSIPAKVRAHDFEGACATISLYNKAGGRVVQGLVNRRAAERALCEQGLNPS